ncbi:helicase-exonuclease AddAB subunit AddA [Butyrivibrio sp. FCS014]|uniref:helicase-exonuclease AddAB subunit AddA n=1 Tax=Butyrivibrio sp. FCS014 TaxID=1408304 RepID=UPI000465EF0C|nr:helicase-exonuclease AddAB subunit AddA [Butyrivibrio sp. FCS014]
MGIEFTEEQQAVIDARKSNILVSAAAGSGKTAVLVERIIQMMSEGLDIDHLLVVTFTRAAAAQMKEKITAAIHERLAQDPEDAHFQRQETLIHNAQITTIDSFCQYVVRNNFNTIGLDPSYRVGDEGELQLLSEEVLNNFLEEEYDRASGEENSDFIYCMDYFSQGNSDSAVSEYINTLYKYSQSMPWPEDWLRQRLCDYEAADGDFDELGFVKVCMEIARDVLKEAASRLELALKLASDPDGPYMYVDRFEAELESVRAAIDSKGYDDSFDRLRNISFDKLSPCRDNSVNADKKGFAQKMRNDAKEAVAKLIKDFFGSRSDQVKEKMAYCDRAVRELVRLTLEFADRFAEEKRNRHIIDFSDMEHFALQILVDHPSEDVSTPSVVALEYRDYYREVLIDEYQDSNSVQEMILKAISGEDPKVSERFMVGDVKQSIYKFRLARPEIFMEKFASFDKDAGSENRRIDLHKNFRSRKEILDITNYIFARIMGADLGKVEYDSDAMLVYGAKYEEPLLDVTPELLLVDDTEDDGDASDMSIKEKEVAVIASRINELRRENPKLSYKDIVILFRSPSGWVDVLKKGLSNNGIPAYMESKSGYFTSYEVSVLLNVMSVIDNPRQNIELISVMKSPVGGFTDEELAKIKIALNDLEDPDLGESYFLGMKSGLALDTELSDKAAAFVALIEEFRTMSTYVPVHELLQLFLNRTDFETVVTAMPYGNQRRANIEQLLNDAANFERTSFKGLFHFVRYIEHLRNSQLDSGEAGIIDENADVVRIMSIHKSKGLEFPVVFVAGMGQHLNFRDSTGNFILDMDLGLGVKYINSELGIKSDTLKRAVIADSMKTESLGEELRVLYVALTRAKEKLIMTAGVKNLAKKVSEQLALAASLGKSGELLPYGKRKAAQSYLDLVLPAVFLHSSMKEIFEKYEIPAEEYGAYYVAGEDEPSLKIKAMGANDITVVQLTDDALSQIRRKELEAPAGNDELEKQLKERLSAKYSHPELTGLFTKTTVTELKKKMLEETGEFDAHEASFAQDMEETGDEDSASSGGQLTGAERGTAYHRIMELLDEDIYGDESLPSKSSKEVCERLDKWIGKLTEKGVIPETYRDCVDIKDVSMFLFTDLGKRMGEAYRNGKLMTEKPFMMGVSASELNEKFPDDETVLVQGIVDAWFIEGDDIILMDYKTDKVREDKDLTDRYSIQLKLYKRALEAATGMKVKEIYIYSFALGRQIQLSV